LAAYGTGAIVYHAEVNPMPKAGGKWSTMEITVALRRTPPCLRLDGSDRALLVWMTRLWPSLLGAVRRPPTARPSPFENVMEGSVRLPAPGEEAEWEALFADA
jgi:hypothetical protein